MAVAAEWPLPPQWEDGVLMLLPLPPPRLPPPRPPPPLKPRPLLLPPSPLRALLDEYFSFSVAVVFMVQIMMMQVDASETTIRTYSYHPKIKDIVLRNLKFEILKFRIQRYENLLDPKDTKTFWIQKIRKPFEPKDTKTFWIHKILCSKIFDSMRLRRLRFGTMISALP